MSVRAFGSLFPRRRKQIHAEDGWFGLARLGVGADERGHGRLRDAQASAEDLHRVGNLAAGLIPHASQPGESSRLEYSRSRTVRMLARSRALVARVPSPNSAIDVS